MTRSATNYRSGVRRVLGKKKSAGTCKKQIQKGGNPLSGFIGSTHDIKCEIVDKDGTSSDNGVTFSPGSAKGPNLAVLKQMLLKDKAFMSKLAPTGVSGPSDDKDTKGKKGPGTGDDVDDSGDSKQKLKKYTVEFNEDETEQMKIIRRFEDRFFADNQANLSTGWYLQKRYSGSVSGWTYQEPAEGIFLMRIVMMLFMIKILKSELDKHEKSGKFFKDITDDSQVQDKRNDIIRNMRTEIDVSGPKYGTGGKRTTASSFYSAFAPVDNRYKNAKPFYKDLENLFSENGEWLDGNRRGKPYNKITEFIKSSFFDDAHGGGGDKSNMAKTFKYNLLLFASYYNKVVSEEGTKYSDYQGNRKEIDDIKSTLLGTRDGTNVTTGSDRSTSVNGALAFMLKGLKNIQGGNATGFDNPDIDYLVLDSKTVKIKDGESKNLDRLNDAINNIKIENITTGGQMPWMRNQKGKGGVTFDDSQEGGGTTTYPKFLGLGFIQVLGILIEGHAVLKKAEHEEGMGQKQFKASNLTSLISGLRRTRGDKQIIKNDKLNEVLGNYIDKFLEIITKVYYDKLLKLKITVKDAKLDKPGENYVASRKEMDSVQQDLLITTIYFNKFLVPQNNNIADADAMNSDTVENTISKYIANQNDLDILKLGGNIVTDMDSFRQIALQDGFQENFTSLHQKIMQNIGEKYNTMLGKYETEMNKLERLLTEGDEGTKQLLKAENFETRIQKNRDRINALHAFFLGEPLPAEGGGDSETKTSSSGANVGDKTQHSDSSPALTKLNVKSLEKPKVLPMQIGNVLEQVLGKLDGSPVITSDMLTVKSQSADGTTQVQPEDSFDKLIEKTVTESVFKEKIKEMQEDFSKFKSKLEERRSRHEKEKYINKLTINLLTKIIAKVNDIFNDEEITDPKEKLKKVFRMHAKMGKITDPNGDFKNIGLFNKNYKNLDNILDQENYTTKTLNAEIDKFEKDGISSDSSNIVLSFFLDYDGKHETREGMKKHEVEEHELDCAEKVIDDILIADEFKKRFARTIQYEFKKDKGKAINIYENMSPDKLRVAGLEGLDKKNVADVKRSCSNEPNKYNPECKSIVNLVADNVVRNPGLAGNELKKLQTDLVTYVGAVGAEIQRRNCMVNKGMAVGYFQQGGATPTEVAEEKILTSFDKKVNDFEKKAAEKLLDNIAEGIINHEKDEETVKTLLELYNTEVVDKIAEELAKSRDKLEIFDAVVNKLKKEAFSFAKYQDLKTEVEQKIDKAVTEKKENDEKANKILENVDKVKKVVKIVNDYLKNEKEKVEREENEINQQAGELKDKTRIVGEKKVEEEGKIKEILTALVQSKCEEKNIEDFVKEINKLEIAPMDLITITTNEPRVSGPLYDILKIRDMCKSGVDLPAFLKDVKKQLITRLNGKKDTAGTEVGKLKEEADQLKGNIKTVGNRIATLETEIAELVRKKEAKLKDLGEAAAATAMEEVGNLKAEEEEKRQELDGLRAEEEEKRQELDGLGNFKERLAGFKAEVIKFKEEGEGLTSVEAIFTEADKAVAEAEERKEQLVLSLVPAKENLAAEQEKVEALDKEFELANEAAEKKKREAAEAVAAEAERKRQADAAAEVSKAAGVAVNNARAGQTTDTANVMDATKTADVVAAEITELEAEAERAAQQQQQTAAQQQQAAMAAQEATRLANEAAEAAQRAKEAAAAAKREEGTAQRAVQAIEDEITALNLDGLKRKKEEKKEVLDADREKLEGNRENLLEKAKGILEGLGINTPTKEELLVTEKVALLIDDKSREEAKQAEISGLQQRITPLVQVLADIKSNIDKKLIAEDVQVENPEVVDMSKEIIEKQTIADKLRPELAGLKEKNHVKVTELKEKEFELLAYTNGKSVKTLKDFEVIQAHITAQKVARGFVERRAERRGAAATKIQSIQRQRVARAALKEKKDEQARKLEEMQAADKKSAAEAAAAVAASAPSSATASSAVTGSSGSQIPTLAAVTTAGTASPSSATLTPSSVAVNVATTPHYGTDHGSLGGKKMRKAIKKAVGKSTMKKRPAKKSNKKKSEKKPQKKRTMNRRIRIRKGTLKK